MRKMLAVILGAGLLVVVGAMFGPRAAHAIVATLVQVVNTSANPVPVTLVPTRTVTVANLNRDIGCQGIPDDEGPFDVSSYSTIRFIGVATFGPESLGLPNFDNAQFQINSVDPAGNQFPLDTLTATNPLTAFNGSTVTVSAVYQMPGNSVQVHITAGCVSSDVIVHVTILGR